MAVHPADIKNSFTSQLAFWILFLPLLTLIFLPLIKAENNIDQVEMEMLLSSGIDIQEVSFNTQERFKRWFVETGIMPKTLEFFNGSAAGPSKTPMIDKATDMGMSWMTGVWALIYKSMWRLQALIWIYAAAIGAVCLPCLLDGFWVRARKRYQFESSNPLIFNMSTHIAVMVLGLLLYIPLIPFALTPTLVACFMAFLGASLWWAAANFQTGV